MDKRYIETQFAAEVTCGLQPLCRVPRREGRDSREHTKHPYIYVYFMIGLLLDWQSLLGGEKRLGFLLP